MESNPRSKEASKLPEDIILLKYHLFQLWSCSVRVIEEVPLEVMNLPARALQLFSWVVFDRNRPARLCCWAVKCP